MNIKATTPPLRRTALRPAPVKTAVHRKIQSDCTLSTEWLRSRAHVACGTSRTLCSESSSLLIDQQLISDALRSYTRSSSEPKRLRVVTTFSGEVAAPRANSLRARIAEKLQIDRTTRLGFSGLMLSPDKAAPARVRTRRAVAAREIALHGQHAFRKTEWKNALMLTASKAERRISTSRAGTLLKCFTRGWLTAR